MAHRRQEAALGFVGRVGRFFCLLHLLKQTGVLDSDGGLAGESLGQVGLLHIIRAGLMAIQGNVADRFATNDHRHAHPASNLAGVAPTFHPGVDFRVPNGQRLLAPPNLHGQGIIKGVLTADDIVIIGKTTTGDGELPVFLEEEDAGTIRTDNLIELGQDILQHIFKREG
jgi:hypothetical protein